MEDRPLANLREKALTHVSGFQQADAGYCFPRRGTRIP